MSLVLLIRSVMMSRYHQRFERDFRGVWERRERCITNSSCGGTVNGCVSTSASSVPNSGNNRPGLLPLPVIPSLLPTPVTGTTSTSNSELTCKRLAPTCTTSTTKVGLNTPVAAVSCCVYSPSCHSKLFSFLF